MSTAHPPSGSATSADSPLGDRATRILRYAVLALSCVVGITWLATAVVHAADRFGVGHGQGVWMALGAALLDGTLYPPLYEHGVVGGTRWMPAPILLQAALDGVSGDSLLAQRLAGALVAVPLYGLGYVILRRLDVGRVLAIGLLACILATPAGFAAALDGGADQLAVLFQLGALALVLWSTSRRAAAVAGALCALALLAKLTAIWAVIAIALVLLVRDRRRAVPFLATYVFVAAALLGATELASNGRFTDNVLALGGSGFQGLGAVAGEAPGRALMIAQDFDQAVWLLAPLAVLALAHAVATRDIDVFHVAWLAAAAVLVVTLADIGAWFNHTLDLAFLTVLLAARVTAGSDSTSVTLRAVATVTVAIGLAGAIFTPADGTFSPRAALVSLAHRENGSDYPARPLEGTVSDDESVLTEDPGLAVSLGRTPVVLDPFMLARLDVERPEVAEAIAQRIERQEFDVIALINPLARSRFWYTDIHLGPTVSTAICKAYRQSGTVGGQMLYTPRTRNLASATLASCFDQ